MTDASRQVGQAVVTDPLQGRASGYTLVASSPSVTPAEAQHLADTPQVTDHLHASESPGPYVGWHRLPSGRWALVRRFTSGLRRGNYHRVVAHALMVPEGVLQATGDDPWLLVARCQFRPSAGGDPRGLTALGTAIGGSLAELTAEALPDLICEAPADPRRERLEALQRRRAFLVEQVGSDTLTRDLTRVFAALARGDRVLLGDASVDVQLLALATSALPANDRLRLGWTTHLATDAAYWFHIANVPDPVAAVARLGADERWLVGGHLADEGGETDEIAWAAAAALARAVVTGRPDLPALCRALREEGLGLLGAPSATMVSVASVATWLEQGGEKAYAGFDTLVGLADWLRAQAIDAPSSRCTSEGALAAASGTALRRVELDGDLTRVLDEVGRVIDSAGKTRALLTPSAVERIRAQDPGGLGGDGVVVASALVLDRPGPIRDADPASSERLALVHPLAASVPSSTGVADLRFDRMADLWRDLHEVGDEAESVAFEALRQAPNGLGRLAGGFGSPSAGAMARVLRVYEAAASREFAVAEDLACRVLLPALDDAVASSALTDEQRRRVLDRLPANLLVTQLAAGTDRLYPEMVAALQCRARARQPNLAAIVASVVGQTEGRLRTDRGYVGLTRLLHEAGVAAGDWLPMALVEAHMLDGGGDQEARQAFRRWLESETALPREASMRWADLVLDQLERARKDGRLDAAHLAVLTATSGGLATADGIVGRFDELLKLATVPVVTRVAPTAIAVAQDLEVEVPERARALRLAVWQALASPRHRWSTFPIALVPSMESLAVRDRQVVARAFAPKLGWLGDDPGNRALRAAIEQAGAGDKAFAARKRVVANAAAGGSLLSIVLDLRSRRAAPPEIKRTLHAALPRAFPDKMRAIMPLMWSSLTQMERNVVEGPLLEEALQRAQGKRWIAALNESVPEAEKLRKSTQVAVALARRVGERWRDDRQGAHGFLKLLIDASLYEAVAVLIARSTRGSDGLLASLAASDSAPRNLLESLRRALDHSEHGHDLYAVRRQIQTAHKTLRSRR